MAVNIEKFELDKNVPVVGIRKFFEAHGLDRTQVLDISVIQKTPNASIYLLTYEDTVAPYVTGTSPTSGASNVPVSIPIVIQMSEAVADVVDADIRATKDNNLVVIGGIATNGSTITITGVVDTDPNAHYVITLYTTVTDLAGNPMEHDYTFGFSTAAGAMMMVFKSGVVTPNAMEIGAGSVNIVFPAPNFTDLNYRIGLALVGALAQPSVVLRASAKAVNGFTINFDGEDFSTVETGIDNADAAVIAAIDAQHKTSINDDHARNVAPNIHAAPINQMGVIVTAPPGGAACVDRAFILNNTIEWMAIWGAG